MIHQMEEALYQLRVKKPLILNLTNHVTTDFVANAQLALGALPIMSALEEELEELIRVSSAVYINIGTLDTPFMTLVKKALEVGCQYNKPIILDPVGAGATKMRKEAAQLIAPFSTILRGNASEILALGDASFTAKGVESAHMPSDAKDIASLLALQYQTTVIVSGPVDLITEGHVSREVRHGSSLMQQVTGMGCAMTAVIAAFRAIQEDSFTASVIGAYYFALCGEIASLHHSYAGSFKTALIDQLHKADFALMQTLYDQGAQDV
ncbi:hydroxyethylthiazole kinase [Rhabdochlamydiaceae symbiont of Dictyostelium giganteum]|uniref:hydroxyethylthiazole kinase n=1 Tax=Rhabdochlamydiaceae symbiont of Dictyostelium giganteum TaxID=3342349 RepID=UPI00384DB50A